MYQALYRKWRPSVFADVVGQEHITTTLMNEINTGRHSHAYLFTGSRGTGKTTCAKIFAKAVNCEHPVNGDPCNCCETCRGIDNGSVLDVVEIDAASNNGVDNIRDIRDEANFTPVGGRYRVYIIDEVHMLSTGAFNALLKTLEEPPAHVKFILATTEVHKLPATILSRCQRFDFKRIRPEDIAGRISYVAEQEGLTLTPEAANLIARLADGAQRDALSILDQCIGHSQNITEEVVNDVVGLAGKDYLFSLANSLLTMDSASALTQVGQLHERSCDMERLCNELINHYRNLMVAKAVRNPKDLIVCSDQELQAYVETAGRCSMDQILTTLNVLGDTLTGLRKGLNRRVEMEMAVIRLCSGNTAPAATAPVIPTFTPVTAAPAAPVAKPAPQPVAPVPQPVPAPTPEPVPAPVEEPLPFGLSDDDVPPPPTEEFVPAAPVEDAPVPMVQAVSSEPSPSFAAQVMPQQPVAQAPAAPATPVSQPMDNLPSGDPQHISLQSTLNNGLLPNDVWNALIREVTSIDKPMIGCMSGAKAAKRGSHLLVLPGNLLLKSFIPQEFHKNAIREATFTVLGEYLTPVVATEEDFAELEKGTATAGEAPVEPVEAPSPVAEEDPLDSFVSSLQSLGIHIDIEE